MHFTSISQNTCRDYADVKLGKIFNIVSYFPVLVSNCFTPDFNWFCTSIFGRHTLYSKH